LTDNRDSRRPSEDVGGPGREMGAGREQQVMLLAGRASCILGLLLGIGGIVAALFGGTANVSIGAVGAALGILGYFLGSRRLGTVTVLLCVAALFFGLAASQGLIPGIDASDRGLPAIEPAAE
jgi:membrane associated rhomboid family serine protease